MILSECQNIKIFFAKGYVPNCSEEGFVIKKIKKTAISDLKDEEIVDTFYKKILQKASQKEFRIKKVIKRKGVKLNVKWKG